MPLKTLPSGLSTILSGGSVSTAKRMISEIANMPIIIGIMPMPPSISMLPNVKRGKPAGLPRPTQATSRPSSSDTKPLSGRSDVMNTAQVRPSSTSQKYSNELNLSANSASVGAARISTAVPKRPPIAEKTSPAPSASSGLALLGHRIRFVRVRRRRGRAGHAHEATGNVAGEDRHGRRGDDRGDRRNGRHEERDRHEQRRGHRRGESRHRADEEAEERCRQHHPDVVGVEDQRERLGPGRTHRGLRTGIAAVTAQCPAEPHGSGSRRHHAMPCSRPHGSGTLSSL